MHATIQKSIHKIIDYFQQGEKVFIVGCGNCAMKCHSGGEAETKKMADRLTKRGIIVTGYVVPGPAGMSLCKLSNTKKVLQKEYKEQTQSSDSFIVLACGQGVHTVIDATDNKMVYPGCDTIFGGETVNETQINEYCSLCGECIIAFTGGLCPMTLCSKSLLNGPCGGAEDGMCEVDKKRACGWVLIYERLKKLNQLDLLLPYQEPKNYAKWSRPRSLIVNEKEATFISQHGKVCICNHD